jgi:hypothetical protein
VYISDYFPDLDDTTDGASGSVQLGLVLDHHHHHVVHIEYDAPFDDSDFLLHQPGNRCKER